MLGTADLDGDLVAHTIIHDIAMDFSRALGNLVCIIHPKLVVMGGQSKDLGCFFLDELKNQLSNTGFKKMTDDLDIQFSHLGKDTYITAAMKYFFDIHFKFTQDLHGCFFIG